MSDLRLIKIEDLAEASGLGESIIRELIKTGDLRLIRVSKRFERVELASFEAWMARAFVEAPVNPYQTEGFVYFVIDDKRRVKIGYSADPHKRLKEMQTGSGSRLHLLAMIPGGLADEQEMHARFDRYRLHREWFRFTGKLRAFVEALADG